MVNHLSISSSSQRGICALMHSLGTFGPLLPLVIWAALRKSSPLVDTQGVEVVNFQIQATLIEVPVALASLFFFGGFPLLVFYFYRGGLSLWGAITTASKESFRYPAVVTRWIPNPGISV